MNGNKKGVWIMGDNGAVVGQVISQKNQNKLQSCAEVCAFGMKMGGRQVTISLLFSWI